VELGVVVQAYNPTTKVLKKEDWEFKASLRYLRRPCLKTEYGDSNSDSSYNNRRPQISGCRK
jgi:hypothetical protein